MKKKILNIGLAVILMFGASSCKDFLDVNQDPNNPTNVSPDLVFPAAVTSTASVVGGDFAILGGIWSQHWTQNSSSSQYRTIDAYNLTNLSFNARWSELYTGALNDYKYVKNQSVEAENWNMNLMATVMEAYTFQVLADLYDRIPFEEALRGDENILNPVYQGGEEVYDGLITRLDAALAKPITGTSPIGENDVVFQGDMNQWRRFANTLKLKLYMRQSEKNPSKAQAGIAKLYAENAQFLTTSAMEEIWEDQASRRNPLFEQDQSPAINTNQNLRASSTFMSYLQDNSDPRIDELFLPATTDGQHRGSEQGFYTATTAQVPVGSTSRPIITPTEPVYFLSEAESFFLQAEAAQRGWSTGDAKSLYESGVRASFRQLGLTNADADPLLATGGDYAYPSASGDQLKAIMTQKWIALAGTKQGIEAFFERNRTNIPKKSPVARTTTAGYVPGEFIYSLNGVTGGVLPKRLIFPQSETTRNVNAPAIVPVTTPVWWDVNGD